MLRLLMILKCILILQLISSSICQYVVDMGMRADMRFDDDNDRFDVGNIIAEQNRVYTERPRHSEFDHRRLGNDRIPLFEVIKQNRLRMKDNMPNGPSRRMNMENFAYHDLMLSEPDDNDEAYEKNLLKFKAKNARKNLQVIDFEKPADTNRVENVKAKKEDLRSTRKKNINDIILRYLHGGPDMVRLNGRRKEVDTDNEVLLHYAVPINMKVNGFLEIPQTDI